MDPGQRPTCTTEPVANTRNVWHRGRRFTTAWGTRRMRSAYRTVVQPAPGARCAVGSNVHRGCTAPSCGSWLPSTCLMLTLTSWTRGS